MYDIYDLEEEEREIRALMKHSERQALVIKQAFSGRNFTKNQQIDNIINHYQFEYAYLKRELNSLDSKIREVKRAAFGQKAIEWFPLLEKLVDDVNFAALMDDPNRLRNAFIKVSSALGIKVKKGQEEKKGEVITVADVKKSLSIAIRIYKNNSKRIIQKKRRLKNPVGRMGSLKEATLKQYESMVKQWDKENDVYKKEIRELSTKLKTM